MRDEGWKALLEERWAARHGERLPKDADDGAARSIRAVALGAAGRWEEAARAFEELLRREGPTSEIAPLALFRLGCCRLELGDARGALEATAFFLELAGEDRPFWWEGVRNVARAADRLGAHRLAVQLHLVVLGVAPDAHAWNGLALALGALGRAGEGLYVLDAARRAGSRDAELERSIKRLSAAAGGRRTPTLLAAPRWSRKRILRAAFRLLGWQREPLPASALSSPR